MKVGSTFNLGDESTFNFKPQILSIRLYVNYSVIIVYSDCSSLKVNKRTPITRNCSVIHPCFYLLFYAVDHPCILAAVSNIQFGSIACTEYSNHYSISVSHYNSFSIYRNSFSTHSNIFDDRESELYVSFISKRSNVSVWERVTILYFINL